MRCIQLLGVWGKPPAAGHRGHRVFAKLNLGTPCLGTN